MPQILISSLLPEEDRILTIAFPEQHNSGKGIDREFLSVILEQTLINFKEPHLLLNKLTIFGQFFIQWGKLLTISTPLRLQKYFTMMSIHKRR